MTNLYNPYEITPPVMPSASSASNPNLAKGIGAATAGLSMFAGWKGMGDQVNAINTNAPAQSVDAFGNPDYNLGNFAAQTAAIKPQGATGGEVLGSVAQGASAGASFGPIGAGIGAVVGAVGSLLGGRRRKRKMAEKRKEALENLTASQENYNQSVQQATQQRQAMSQYTDQTNNYARMQNLFNIDPRII